MPKTVDKIIKLAKSWIGLKESDGSYWLIIDVYNNYKPLPRGYALNENDAWCAAFVSALAIKCGYTDIIPLECSCGKLIEKFKALGCWVEDENRIPNVGDFCFYDWEDNGSGDNKETPNHVGIVSKVNSKTFEVIEGNKSNAVGVRTVDINGKYLRGFGVPKYETLGESSYIIYTVSKGDTLRKIAKLYGVTVDEIMACNLSKIKNPDNIKVGWELNIPVQNVSGDSKPPSESLETTNYYAIGKRFMNCIEAIKGLPEYAALLEAIKSEGD